MSDPASPLPPLRKVAAPDHLLASVSRQGSRLVRENRPRAVPRHPRKLVADVGLASFCLVQLAWCAHVIGLIP